MISSQHSTDLTDDTNTKLSKAVNKNNIDHLNLLISAVDWDNLLGNNNVKIKHMNHLITQGLVVSIRNSNHYFIHKY